MEELKKYGDLYIKFDDKNVPEYGFFVKNNYIFELIYLNDTMPSTIILPTINDEINNNLIRNTVNKEGKTWDFLKSYAQGRVQVIGKCFKSIKEATIIVPTNTSIILSRGCFPDDANISLVLPENMTLKQIYWQFSKEFEYESDNWTLIADKSFKIDTSDLYERYSSCDYNNQHNAKLKVSNFKENSQSSEM